ncbi:MAG TPA: cysteine hydrolase family protein, partial [Clostridia bacterium]|nr:cysteine hydrolase family protein [Clostridia bacterium]
MENFNGIIFDKTKTALIVVDMQNAFLHKEGSISQLGLDIERVIKTIEPVSKLIKSARAKKLPVIFLKMCLGKDYTD